MIEDYSQIKIEIDDAIVLFNNYDRILHERSYLKPKLPMDTIKNLQVLIYILLHNLILIIYNI